MKLPCLEALASNYCSMYCLALVRTSKIYNRTNHETSTRNCFVGDLFDRHRHFRATMETRIGHTDDPVGRKSHARKCLARISATAIRPRTLAELERFMGI